MSLADGTRIRRSAGFTFIEMMITMAMLTLLALVIERTISAAHTTERQRAAIQRATERSEGITYEILADVAESHRLFGGDADGMAYLGALELTRDPLLTGARLPIVDEIGELVPDEQGTPLTGNVLLFAVEMDPAPVVADPSRGTVRYIDMYRFVCIYPRRTTRKLIVGAGRDTAVDLVMWRSTRFPNQAQILALGSAAERRAAVKDLVKRFDCGLAWDPAGALTESFYTLSETDSMSATPQFSPEILEDQDVSDRGRLVYTDCQLSPTVAAEYHRRGIYTSDDPATWTPEGFEVKIVGPSSARRVWIHVVVETQTAKDVLGVHASTVLARTRDL